MAQSELLRLEGVAAEILKNVPLQVIGARIRRERQAQGLSIRVLAKQANLGINSVVRLESGVGFRHTTLVKVCEALGLHLERLASASHEVVAVHRRTDDRWHELDSYDAGELPLGSTSEAAGGQGINPLMLLQSRLASGKLLPTLIEVHSPTKARSHPGEEFVYVLRGPICVTVSGDDYVLETGESIDFWGAELHAYAPVGDAAGLVLSVRVSS
ncbi:MAG: helix-turn-helix transcriptional regulator [Armatimonadetes bacterium]|nr:helix-turn-helix transcriptional regulator [Armatimonadota bacterium]